VKTDPLAARPRYILANALMAAGRFDEAAPHIQKLPDDFPGKINWLERARVGQGRIREAIEILEDPINRGDEVTGEPRGFLGYV
jgi:hypothetical protein